MGEIVPGAEIGALLRVLAGAVGATQVLEIGTAIGYSTIWLARALPPTGRMFTMEMNPERAQEARANIERAGLADRVVVMVGDAERLVAKVAGPFDLIFQDGDKRLYSPMLERLVALLRPGGLLVTDNVLRDGEYNKRLAGHPSLLTATVPLRDGVAISLKR